MSENEIKNGNGVNGQDVPTPSNVIPINQSKKKLAKQIAEKGNEIKDLESKVNLLNKIIMGQANFMNSITTEIDNLKRNLVETTTTLYTLIESHLNIDLDALQENVDKKKIQMFEEGTKEEDKKDNAVTDESGEIKGDSIVVITSSVGDDGKVGVLRSRLDLRKPVSVPNLKEGLIGMKLGETKELTIGDMVHNIKVLDIKKIGNTL